MVHKKWYAVHSASGAHIGLWSDMDIARGVRDNEYPDGTITELVENGRPCTCHPDDNPPNPCAEKYALTECVNSHASLVEENKRMREALEEVATGDWNNVHWVRNMAAEVIGDTNA